MELKERVLARLAEAGDGYVSGQRLAEELGVSRAAVWKAISALRAGGRDVDAVTNRGYRLSPGAEPLAAGLIERLLPPETPPLRFYIHRSLPSTNQAARTLALEGEDGGAVVLSETQTAGQGRMGRDFFSPPGGLYMSLLLRPGLSAGDSLLLTTAAAAAAAGAIEALAGEPAEIKWVNDILLGGKKVCGILTEGAVSMETGMLDYAVVGIGVNLTPPEGGFPPELKNAAGAMLPEGAAGSRCALAAGILGRFFGYYASLTEKPYFEEYRRRLAFMGEPVSVLRAGESRPARALGLDGDFRLLVEYDGGGREYISSGEISVRPR